MSALGAQDTHGRAAARQQISADRAALRFDVMVTFRPLEALSRDSPDDFLPFSR